MSDYLITLSQSGRLSVSVTMSTACFAEARELMHQHLPTDSGFELHIETHQESRQLLGQGPQGVCLSAMGYVTEELKDG